MRPSLCSKYHWRPCRRGTSCLTGSRMCGSLRMIQRLDESQDGVVEHVVAVAGDHVSGTSDIDVLGVRHEVEESTCTLLRQQVALSPTHEQGRNGDAPGGRL